MVYEEPDMKIISLETEDVIAASQEKTTGLTDGGIGSGETIDWNDW